MRTSRRERAVYVVGGNFCSVSSVSSVAGVKPKRKDNEVEEDDSVTKLCVLRATVILTLLDTYLI